MGSCLPRAETRNESVPLMQRAVFVSDAIATRTCAAESAAEAYYDAYKVEPFGRGHVPVSRQDFRQKYSGKFGKVMKSAGRGSDETTFFFECG